MRGAEGARDERATIGSEAALIVRVLGGALLAVDVGSLSLLLWNLGFSWYSALGLGAGVGGITTYGAQWRYLLSKRAYERSERPLRYAIVAAVVLVANVGGFWLVARRLFYSYLAVRLATAVMVLVAWGRDRKGWRRKL